MIDPLAPHKCNVYTSALIAEAHINLYLFALILGNYYGQELNGINAKDALKLSKTDVLLSIVQAACFRLDKDKYNTHLQEFCKTVNWDFKDDDNKPLAGVIPCSFPDIETLTYMLTSLYCHLTLEHHGYT